MQESKRSPEDLCGRNDGNVKVIFPRKDLPSDPTVTNTAPVEAGDYVLVKVSSNLLHFSFHFSIKHDLH